MSAPHFLEPTDPTAALAALRETCRSIVLATVAADGVPDASYAPYVVEPGSTGALLILVSRLARHTTNLLQSRTGSAMLIEDESATGQIFARRRITLSCRVEPIERRTAAWTSGLAALEARHGAIVATLRDLADFELLRLVPERGTLVLGFGRAFRLGGPGCTELVPIGPPAS